MTQISQMTPISSMPGSGAESPIVVNGANYTFDIATTLIPIATRTALANITGQTAGTSRYLTESGREGMFVFSTANLSSQVTADTTQAIYVAPSSDPTGASGAWGRKYTEALDVRWFGAVGDGVTNDTSALQAFINAVTTGGGRGYIAPGNYLISSQLTINLGSVGFEIVGAGNGGNGSVRIVASASFTGSTAIQISGSGTSIGWTLGGFTVSPATGSAATTGIQIGRPAATTNINGYQFSTIRDVMVSGFVNNWTIVHARMIHFVNCAGWNQAGTFGNNCLNIYQNGHFTGDLVFDTCQFVNVNAASEYCVNIASSGGAYNVTTGDYSVAGIKFLNCDLYAGSSAVNANVSGGSYLSDIWFICCQVDQVTATAYNFSASGSGSTIQDIHFADNYIAKSTGAQVQFSITGAATASNIFINNNVLLQTAVQGVNLYGVGGTIKNVEIVDNQFPDANSTAALIEVNTATYFTARGNKSTGVFGATNAAHIIQVESGCSNFELAFNSGTTSGSVINDLSGNVTKTIVNNPGYNPIAASAIAVGASPFAYTNTSGALQMVTVSGGTVSAISLGTAIGALAIAYSGNNQITVPAGSTLTVTYSVVPNMYSQGLN